MRFRAAAFAVAAALSVAALTVGTAADTTDDLQALITLTPQQSLALFGSSIPAEYYDGSGVNAVTFGFVGLLSEILSDNYKVPVSISASGSFWDFDDNPLWAGSIIDGPMWGSGGINTTDWLVYSCPIDNVFSNIGYTVEFTIHVEFPFEIYGLEQFGFCTASSFTQLSYRDLDNYPRYNPVITFSGVDTETGAFESVLSQLSAGYQGSLLGQAYTIPFPSEAEFENTFPSGNADAFYYYTHDLSTGNILPRNSQNLNPVFNRVWCIFQGGNLQRPHEGNSQSGVYNIFSINGCDVKYMTVGSPSLAGELTYTYNSQGVPPSETDFSDLQPQQVYIFIACPKISGNYEIPEPDKTMNDIYSVAMNIDGNLVSIGGQLGDILVKLDQIYNRMSSGGGGVDWNPDIESVDDIPIDTDVQEQIDSALDSVEYPDIEDIDTNGVQSMFGLIDRFRSLIPAPLLFVFTLSFVTGILSWVLFMRRGG